MIKSFLRQLAPGRALGVTLIVLLLAASGILYTFDRISRSDPDLFYKALEANLSVDGLTCRIKDTAADRSSDQTVSLDLKGKGGAVSKTTIKHGSDEVTTEGINTAKAEYVRYLTIRTGQTAGAAQPDFSKVIGVWGRQEVDPAKPTSLYGQTVLGGCIVPLANLSDVQREKYGTELRLGKTFQTNTNSTATQTVDGRPLRAFQVTVQPQPYITLMKRLAADLELRELDAVSVEQYATRKPETMTFLVDAGSKQLRMIRFKDRQRTIAFSDYGSRPRITEPEKSIPTTELQERLKNVR